MLRPRRDRAVLFKAQVDLRLPWLGLRRLALEIVVHVLEGAENVAKLGAAGHRVGGDSEFGCVRGRGCSLSLGHLNRESEGEGEGGA